MTKKQKLRSKADELWFSKYCQPLCEVCYNVAIQCHHFYYKSSYGHLRYDPDNGISLCQKCHFVLHRQDPKKIEEQIIARRGIKWYNKLKKKSQEKLKPRYQTISYYDQILEDLKVGG